MKVIKSEQSSIWEIDNNGAFVAAIDSNDGNILDYSSDDIGKYCWTINKYMESSEKATYTCYPVDGTKY